MSAIAVQGNSESVPNFLSATGPWDIAYFFEHLGSRLPPGSAEFLTALVAAMNDRANLAAIDAFPEWRNQPPILLDTPWPRE